MTTPPATATSNKRETGIFSSQASSPPGRRLTLDVARGLAVLGMIYVHFVPSEGATTVWGEICAAVARLIEDKTAVLFCVLVGMTQAIQASQVAERSQSPRFYLRRVLVLAVAGLALHVLVWSTEILLPLALMMLMTAGILRLGRKVLLGTCLLLVAAPAFITFFAGQPAGDASNARPGQDTGGVMWTGVQALVWDGTYPLIPWTFFPLLGAALMSWDWSQGARVRSWFGFGLALAVSTQVFTGCVSSKASAVGRLAPYLVSIWTPTTVPFLVLTGASAVTVVAGLAWWEQARGLPRGATLLALFGRASLTHYLLHICLVYAPLRLAFPEEDWSLGIGLSAALAYLLLALPLTALWFRRFARGPFEMLWAMASGRP